MEGGKTMVEYKFSLMGHFDRITSIKIFYGMCSVTTKTNCKSCHRRPNL